QLVYHKVCSPLAQFPGPWYVGLGEFDLIYRLITGKSYMILHQRHLKYGPIMRIGVNAVSICDYQLAKQLVANPAFIKPSDLYEKVFEPFLPNIFTTCDSVFHKKRQRLLAPVFSWNSLYKVEDVIIESGVRPLMTKLHRLAPQTNQFVSFNLYWDFQGLAFDIIGRLAFGKSFNVLQTGDRTVLDWFNDYFVYTTITRVFSFLKGRSVPFIPALERGLHAHRSLLQLATQAVTIPKQDCQPPSDILQFMIDSADPETGEGLTTAELASESLVQLVAGTDTTSHALTWIVYALLSHPHNYQRLVDEVLTHFPLPSPAVVNYAEAKAKLPYLEAVIQESLRFYPPAPPAIYRIIPSEGVTINGYFVPGGKQIATPIYSVNHSPWQWDRPDEFRPERWLDGRKPSAELKKATLTFFSGPRGCLGRNLSMMELHLTMTNLVRQF
ncbi:cytochrome P450, partial [Dimargaris cristalligena]